ncbi:hypothetical protein ELZ21_13095, partial [Brucella abortus]
RVIFEYRSGAYLRVREHRTQINCSLQSGITKNATVVLELFQQKCETPTRGNQSTGLISDPASIRRIMRQNK